MRGDSQYTSPVRVQIQPQINYRNTNDLLTLIDEINFNAGIVNDPTVIATLYRDLGIPMPSFDRTAPDAIPGVILTDISTHFREQPKSDILNVLQQLNDHGIRALTNNSWNSQFGTIYTSLLGDLNPTTTNLGFTPGSVNLQHMSLTNRLLSRIQEPSLQVVRDIPKQINFNNPDLVRPSNLTY